MIGNRQRGVTLVELMVGIVITLFLGSVFWGIMTISYGVNDNVVGANLVRAEARKAVEILASHLTNAQLNTSTVNGVLNSAIHAASASDITYYTDNTGTDTVRYRYSNGTLLRTDSGGDTTVATDIQSVSLKYFKATAYNSAWAPTKTADAPEAGELPQLAGVEIKIVVTRDGRSADYTSVVRLRNSPKKSKLSGF
ncbi:MAG TPA: prepilin-type N-terminal cleavage/methylation domain-containing protein [Fimbriimonadaceae bacterium]|nr:prepilin-type N-terminal cleavage/methylation domain-containing protein [Fimbriimonadaceae bacterium]